MKVVDIAFGASAGILVGVAAWVLYPLGPPVTYLDKDVIEPKIVKAGESIRVTRSFVIHRAAPVILFRRVIKGDCNIKCDVLDWPTSTLPNNVLGEKIQTREFVLPKTMDTGEWRIAFTAQWENQVGVTQHIVLKELHFTVVE